MTQRTGKLVSRWTRVNGQRWHAMASVPPAEKPSPVVVMVHGIGIASSYFVPLAERLAPRYRVYAIDLPGFGQTAKPGRPLNFVELSDALDDWMKASSIESAAVIGNSVGCQIAVNLAVRHPGRVRRMVLVGPTVDPEGRTILSQLTRWGVDLPREDPGQLPMTLRDYWRAGPRRIVATFKFSLEDRIEEKLPRVSAPTMVVRGARDPIVPQQWAEEAVRLLPNGRLIVIPGAPHALNFAAPLEVSRVIRPFLDEQPAMLNAGGTQ
ncbi:MAG: alpha/beta hydrolase [Dehalococcoidia bacterium]